MSEFPALGVPYYCGVECIVYPITPILLFRSNTLRSSVLSRYSSLRSAKKAMLSATTTTNSSRSDPMEMADIRVNYTSALAENNHVRKVGRTVH